MLITYLGKSSKLELVFETQEANVDHVTLPLP